MSVMCCCCRSVGWNWVDTSGAGQVTPNTNIAFAGPSCSGNGLWVTGEPGYDDGACQSLWHCVASLALAVALEDVTRLAPACAAVCRSNSPFTIARFVRSGSTTTNPIVGLADLADANTGTAFTVVCEIDL
jgi:hypothetical protein